MSITIKSAIVNILNSSGGSAIVSDVPLIISDDLNNYLSKVIEKSFFSDDIKTCEFKTGSNFWNQCNSVSWDIVTISRNISNSIFAFMKRNNEIPSADILYGIAMIENTDYFYMLKMDYKNAYVHFAESKNNEVSVNIIQNSSLWPAHSSKLLEGFFVFMDRPLVKVLEKKYTVDGIKDYYISSQILACAESATPRQKATRIMKAAEKIATTYYKTEDDIDIHIASMMNEELKKEDSVYVETLGEKFFKKNLAAQNEFYEILSQDNISRDDALCLSENFQKKFQKQSLKSASGVEIRIPTQLYSDENEIEFINNPDGTVSLLIKNIEF